MTFLLFGPYIELQRLTTISGHETLEWLFTYEADTGFLVGGAFDLLNTTLTSCIVKIVNPAVEALSLLETNIHGVTEVDDDLSSILTVESIVEDNTILSLKDTYDDHRQNLDTMVDTHAVANISIQRAKSQADDSDVQESLSESHAHEPYI